MPYIQRIRLRFRLGDWFAGSRISAAVPKLIITTEAQGKVAYEFSEDLITIGRAPDSMIVLDDPSVSGHHAQLELSGETYRLKDLDSTNGTRVNGIPITDTALRFDDRIRFGAVEARFEPDTRGSQPLPPMEQMQAKGADTSVAPVDFENASPFPRRTRERDPVRNAVLVGALIAFLAFLGSMVAVLAMNAPVL
jgi:pSer/pThr/pTyr-binding forkhead associated (FHA) protein